MKILKLNLEELLRFNKLLKLDSTEEFGIELLISKRLNLKKIIIEGAGEKLK